MKIPFTGPPSETLTVVRSLHISWRRLLTVMGLTVVLAITEGAGIGMLMPILIYAENGGRDMAALESQGFGWLPHAVEVFHLPTSLLGLLVIAVTPFLMRQLAYYLKNVAAAQAQYYHQMQQRKADMELLIRAGLPFFIRTSEGRAISMLLVDSDRASTIVRYGVDICGSILLLITYVFLLLIISPWLTLTTLPMFGFSAVMIRRYLKRGRRVGKEISENSEAFSRAVTDAFRGVRLIKMRGLEDRVLSSLCQQVQSLADGQVYLQRVNGLLESTAQPVLIIGAFAVLYVAVERFGLHLAELGMFMFLVTRCIPQLIQINNYRLYYQSAVESHFRLKRLTAEAAASQDVKSGTVTFPGLRESIVFDDISFSYRQDENEIPALSRVNLTIPRGDMVALVGHSGAGKSTIADLLCRFYDPTQGRILIDGLPLSEYELSSFRRKIGFVMQDAVFFHDTIRANVEIGLDQPLSDEKLREYLKKSHAAEFVDQLPNGVDTVIGERGLRLSGGQRQRLALTRALAQMPDLLVLDEPTSSLDTISEREIQASLSDMHKRITIVVIAHRLTTIRNADRIFVMQEGHVIDHGTHASLYDRGGAYKNLVEMQVY